MVSAIWLQRLVLACLATTLLASGEYDYHLMIQPQSPVLEIGTDFMATCMIINTTEVVADDLYWNLSKTTIPKEHYTKINEKTVNVTVPITNENSEWLYCLSRKESLHVQLNRGKFIHGILLTKGYLPRKPENLSCVAVQEQSKISPVINCEWEPVGRQTQSVPTVYKLNISYSDKIYNVSTTKNHANVTLDIYPSHMMMNIWVEASNKLGKTTYSEHLREDAGFFVKTYPPSDVKIFPEKIFPSSLLINWTHPIAKQYLELMYEIRFRAKGSQIWNQVPPADMDKNIQSFRLQNLQPDTVYDIQVRCKNAKPGHGRWSDWSTSTEKTPEDQPRSKPDVWRIVFEGVNERRIKFISKVPVLANGKILRYDIMIQGNRNWEHIPVNWSASSPSQEGITDLKEIHLADQKSVKVDVTAINSVGTSPPASLIIPAKAHEIASVKDLKVWPHDGQLWVEWKDPSNAEYVVEWVSNNHMDWQRENRSTRLTAIKGNLKKFVCYNVSVYPIHSGSIGSPVTMEAFLEEGAPLEGPLVQLNGKPGRKAELVWKEIPQDYRRGFITNYTIFYTSGSKRHNVTVPANITSYTLTSLSLNTKYDVWIRASTIQGVKDGFNHSFTTLKYAPGEIEGIVVGVSFGFLFVILVAMLLCLYKKDVIKDNFWPKIPNPGESTIGTWCPDYPLKAETPKENCVPGISVLDVTVCDGKCVFEEDKASLPLKKDKYLSEEHSSGIGGSSCMSSPRQSVSDSDEGGDMADTTASTVQYSSVMASSGYKGQTPSSQPQQAIFSRSESTQPLLDSEENQDMLLQEVNRQSQCFHQQTCFRDTARHEDSTDPAGFNQLEMEQQEMLEPLDFCPLEEESEKMTPTDDQAAAPASSYMPQLCGYRPQ